MIDRTKYCLETKHRNHSTYPVSIKIRGKGGNLTTSNKNDNAGKEYEYEEHGTFVDDTFQPNAFASKKR